MARHKKLHITVHVPELGLKALLGEMSVEILKSATASSSKIEYEGFQFHYPSIESAVENLSSNAG
jgi:NAD dependent epimerase/dehydratase family enzyme